MLLSKIRARQEAVEERLEVLAGMLDDIGVRVQAIARAQSAERDAEVSRSEHRELELHLERELDEFGRKIDFLSQAVVEGISNVERRESRIRSTVGRARKELEEAGLSSPGVEAEYRELQVLDGGRGNPGGVPPVRENVEDPRDRFAAFPGIWDDRQDLASGG